MFSLVTRIVRRGQACPLIRRLSTVQGYWYCLKGVFPGQGGFVSVFAKRRFQFESPSVRSLGGIRGDDAFRGFLEEEIASEKKMQRLVTMPATFEGYAVTVDRSKIVLSKKHGKERIIISCDVNHSVYTELDEDPNQDGRKHSSEDMQSKPNFKVKVKRGKETLSLSCSFVPSTGERIQGEFGDLFAIDEVAIYDGDRKEQDYAVAGDILDAFLYDSFMSLLEERDITNEFISKFSEFCTNYEHKLYVEMLVKLQNFLGNK